MNKLERAEEFKKRTKEFAINIIRLYRQLPKTEEARIIGRQLLRAGTSVASNYRAACRGRSRKEFIAKLGIAIEEADETVFWLEMLRDGRIHTSKFQKVSYRNRRRSLLSFPNLK